jgi:GNAT superfamily N-acetyltransferase
MIIRTATSKDDYRQVAALMRAFLDWHGERHAADRQIVETYFDPQAFSKELDNLPGEFAEPRGRLLVAEEDGRIAGCVALRDLGGGACEMKRMFVYPEFHGRGVGQLLGRAIISEAKAIGYCKMLLDTGPAQREAQALYRKLGFKDVELYYDLSAELRNWLVFMERDLTD